MRVGDPEKTRHHSSSPPPWRRIADGDEIVLSIEQKDFHRHLFSRVFIPVILSFTVFFVICHWRDDTRFYWGLVTVIAVDTFNFIVSTRNFRIPSPWGVIETHSDAFDTFRWTLNLILDLFIMWSFQVSRAIFFAAWLVIAYGAITEIYHRRMRLFITVQVVAGFVAGLFYLPFNRSTAPMHTDGYALIEQMALCYAFLCLIYVFWVTQRWVVKEMTRHFDAMNRYREVAHEAEAIKRDAALGGKLKVATHELGNLITVIDFQAAMADQTSPHVKSIRKAVEYVKKINRLVLDDVKNLTDSQNAKRRYSFGHLKSDIELLIAKDVAKRGISLEIMSPSAFGDSPEGFEFDERIGSTYLILHNVIKNSVEAIVAKREAESTRGTLPSKGLIKVSFASTAVRGRIIVEDDGIGMSEEQVEAILSRRPTTTKAQGHGLGTVFALEECQNNGFELHVHSAPNSGCRVEIEIPAVPAST